MAFEQLEASSFRTMRASSNVSAISWTGNPPLYSSGGLAFGSGVIADTGTGFEADVQLPAAVGADILGVAHNYPAAAPGDAVQLVVRGIVKMVAASAMSYNDLVEIANSSGQVQTARATTVTYVIGRAMTAATGSGDYVSVELNLTHIKAST